MSEPKTIYCPQCRGAVTKYDGCSTINPIANCRKCRKRIIYHVDSDKTEIKPIPPRTSSSGMTFY